jgi:hypothetical protein
MNSAALLLGVVLACSEENKHNAFCGITSPLGTSKTVGSGVGK